MCGLTGWMMPAGSTWRPNKKLIEFWLKGIESRGRQATGYFTLTDEPEPRRFWMKGPVTASEFVTNIQADTTPVGRIGLMHTRSATIGTPYVNKNNHPIVVGRNFVTHNGGFSEYKKVYEKLGITEPVAEVDSAIIPHAFDVLGYKEGLRVISEETAGLAAIVAVLPNLDILMARDGRPLFLARLPEGGRMWSSEPDVCFATPDEDWETWAAMRFPAFKYALFDGQTLKIKDAGGFILRTPSRVSAVHTSGMGEIVDYMGFKPNASATHNPKHAVRGARICVWGKCCDVATKTVYDTDGKQKMVCKPHKKMWRRGSPIPNAWEPES
jgi:hypothetical protein